MSNLLKKIQVGNPLYNFGRMESLKAYENAKDDEELAKVLHQILDKEDGNKVLTPQIYGMIAFATDYNVNAQMLIL